tara:strand:+ start:291 stop:1013 length:723 start_codon:yes stop_codon:yes gene_type:complete
MRLKNIFLFFFLTFFVFNYGVSQNNEVGFFFGLTNYIGDVGPTTYINPFSDEKYSVFGVLYKKNISKRVAIRGGVNFAEIGSNDIWKGSTDYRAERAKSFKNKLEEINLSLEFNFREFDVTSAKFQHSSYVRSGVSYFRFDDLFYPEGIDQAQSFAKHNEFSIPISVGYKIKPNKSFALSFEITANHSFSENLDGSYPKRFEDYELYSQKSFGGNLSQDWYVFTGFTLTYIFGNYECYCP